MNWLRKFFCLVAGHEHKKVSEEVRREDANQKYVETTYRCIYCGDREYSYGEVWK